MSSDAVAWAFGVKVQPLAKLILIWCADAGRTSLREAWRRKEALLEFCGGAGGAVTLEDLCETLCDLEIEGHLEQLVRFFPSAAP